MGAEGTQWSSWEPLLLGDTPSPATSGDHRISPLTQRDSIGDGRGLGFLDAVEQFTGRRAQLAWSARSPAERLWNEDIIDRA
jgi:hypothetical protein